MCENCKDAEHKTEFKATTAAGRKRSTIKCSANCVCHDVYNFGIGNVPMRKLSPA